jgi:hypothetical protein
MRNFGGRNGHKESLSDLGGRILEGHHIRSVETSSLTERGTTGAPDGAASRYTVRR